MSGPFELSASLYPDDVIPLDGLEGPRILRSKRAPGGVCSRLSPICIRLATAVEHGQPADRSAAVMTEGVEMHEHSKRPRRRLHVAVAAAIGLVPAVLAGAALATDPAGVISGSGNTEVLGRGTLGPNLVVNSKSGIHVKTKGSADIVTQRIVIGVAGHTGWHSHRGPVLVTIVQGALQVIYADDASCQGTVYEAGDSFIDRGDETVHIARNASSVSNVSLYATYLVPGVPGSTFRLNEPAANSC